MRIFVLVFALLLLAGSVRAADGFFKAMPDVPLMPGLIEQASGAVSFDKPGGRIEDATAAGAVDAAAIRDFYQRTLPQLGWRSAGRDSFARDGERLILSIKQGANGAVLQVAIEPRSGG